MYSNPYFVFLIYSFFITMTSNPLNSPGIKLKSKRPRIATDYEKCIKCQTVKANEKLQTGMPASITRFIHCAKIRKDEVFRRIEPDIENNQLLSDTIKWHKSCYSAYTSNHNVKFHVETQPKQVAVQSSAANVILRSTVEITNWKLCLVCQQKKCKGEKELTHVATKQVYNTLMQAAEHRRDEQMMTRIRDEDLIAVEAKYHRGCYQRYTVVTSSLSKSSTGDEKGINELPYDRAFINLIDEIGHKLVDEGRAYDMSTLTHMYRSKLIEVGIDKGTADMYKVQNLKTRLIKKFGKKIAFHTQFERNKAELVCSASLNISEIINLVAELQGGDASSPITCDMDTSSKVLYYAAVILRSEMKEAGGIETHPLNVSDLSLEKAKELVPSKLQLLLKWLMQSQRSFDAEFSPVQDTSDVADFEFTEAERRKVLAIGQDILTCNSGGKKKMPKNVGLGVALKTMVRGKEIVRMLNHHGHCINYWECEQIETEWAEMSLSRFDEGDGYYQAILPSNIEAGRFAQCAADNVDYVQDTVDGKGSVHVMSIAFYQGGFAMDPKHLLNDDQRRSKIRQRALKSAETKFFELPLISKTPAPSIVKKAKVEFFESCGVEREKVQGLNRAWICARNTPTRLLDVHIERNEIQQKIPGWTGFHVAVSVHHSLPSRIGFPPMIPAPVTEPNTVYTCLRSLDKTFRESLHQENCVVTFDEGIYCEAKRIQWAMSPELNNIVIRMGGFHRAKNFIGLIGKRMVDSGVEDLWIESDICGSSVASKIISGTHYNRAVRAHKLTLEALERLQWESFIEWAREMNKVDETSINCVNEKKQALINSFQLGYQYVVDHKEEIHLQVMELDSTLSKKLSPLFKEYKEQGCKSSSLFAFWNEYIEMVWLLLDFIHGDRDGNWLLHLEAFTEMLPYDRAFDHLNYFRWGSVYITDMKRLQEIAPSVHSEFTENKAHAVSTSPKVSSFSAVSPDMALEQTMNKDSKTKGGIVGVSGMQGTRDKWTLSAHLMAAATTATKVMSGLSAVATSPKEFGPERLQRDESDVQNIVKCLRKQMSNPFDISEYEGETLALINIATGTVAPPEVSESLLTARAQGEKAMGEFVQDRLISGKTNFWEPLRKTNTKTFQSLNKPIKVGKDKQTLKTINIDRQVYSRLLVISKDRDIDLQEVLSYELAPVPLALANMDGSLRKPNKSILLKELDMDNNDQTSFPAGNCDQTAYIVDLLAVIQMITKQNMKLFGELSDTIAANVMSKFKFAKQVHVVPDRYDIVDSIKAGERSRRSVWNAPEVKIQGRGTKLPACLKRYLSNGKNKSNLLSFLVSDWSAPNNVPSQLKEGEILVVATQDGKAMRITSTEVESDIPLLSSDHEEADSRMFVHCDYLAKTSNNNFTHLERIIIFSPDTDVAVLCWHHFTELKIKELWFHTGTGRSKRYIPIHKAVQQVGTDVCMILPAMHALTGCDSTSNLHGIGKKGAFSVLKKNKESLNELQLLGSDCSTIDDETFKVCLKFIALLYGEATSDLNQLRYKLFTKKQLDSSKLPPTEDSALLHIQRANFQCFIWKHARDRNLALASPDGNGWSRDEKGILVPKLMENDPAPESLLEFVVCRCKKGCHARCSCQKAGLSCTLACECSNECENKQQDQDEIDI